VAAPYHVGSAVNKVAMSPQLLLEELYALHPLTLHLPITHDFSSLTHICSAMTCSIMRLAQGSFNISIAI
jgi:hypothetical protein